VTQGPLERLLRLVAGTEDEELTCTQCFDLLPQYVDLELAGRAPDLQLPLFRRHLEQCAVCREEYETLRDLVRADADEPPPAIDEAGGRDGLR
jgi:hypothetical protein